MSYSVLYVREQTSHQIRMDRELMSLDLCLSRCTRKNSLRSWLRADLKSVSEDVRQISPGQSARKNWIIVGFMLFLHCRPMRNSRYFFHEKSKDFFCPYMPQHNMGLYVSISLSLSLSHGGQRFYHRFPKQLHKRGLPSAASRCLVSLLRRHRSESRWRCLPQARRLVGSLGGDASLGSLCRGRWICGSET